MQLQDYKQKQPELGSFLKETKKQPLRTLDGASSNTLLTSVASRHLLPRNLSPDE